MALCVSLLMTQFMNGSIASSQGISKLKIHTDSQFLINCVTQWMKNWKKNGWKTKEGKPVKNRSDLEPLDEAMKNSGKK